MSERTLEDDLKKNLRPWPQDWDWHVVRTANLVFDNNKIPKIVVTQSNMTFFAKVGSIVDESSLSYGNLREHIINRYTDLRMVIEVDDSYIYIGMFGNGGDNVVSAKVYRVDGLLDNLPEEDTDDNKIIFIKLEKGFAYANILGTIEGKSGYSVVEELDSLLRKDYWDNQHGGDEEEDSPTPDPVDSLDKSPSMAT